MKEFNNNGLVSSFDIVHMVGSKEDYTITEIDGKLIYESSTHKYIIDDVEVMGFFKTGNVFSWIEEFEPFINYGLTADRPFVSLAQITNVGHSGTVKLWSTLGGALISPIEVLMNFNDGVTPWFSVSFDFSDSVWGDTQVGDSILNGGFNNENMIGSSVTTDSNVGSFKWDGGSTGNIDMGFGSQAGFEVIGKSNWDGNYHINFDTEYQKVLGPINIAYKNPATNLNFTSEQMIALRGFVSSISTKTPFIAWHGDTDGQSGADSAPSNTFNSAPGIDGGHNISIQDTDGNWLNLVPRGVGDSNEGVMVAYTENTFNIRKTTSGSYTGSITLPTGLYSPKLILPSNFSPMINTGGGVGFGAYQNTSIAPIVNNKTVFLIR